MSQTTTPRPAENPALSFADFRYRCVCGESLDIDPVEGGTCAGCGRHYCPSILQEQGGGETVLVSQCGERSLSTLVDDGPDPLIGQEWEHYKIVERIGEGGMGAVYRALDESLQRYVALKVIREADLTEKDSPQVQQLFQEARAQARVNHPNVVHIYFVGKSNGAPFFAMELINGPTLEQRLLRGPIEFHEVVRIANQVTEALKHAARYDIVHGDIKPSNLLQADARNIKLSDFGLARRLSELQAGEGGLAGTPNYLSPETASGKSTDFRSDMYSLGVTLFELTFGKLPYTFSSSSIQERLQAHQTKAVEFPELWPESVPQVWRDVLTKLLAKDPAQRFKDYDELLCALRKVQPLSLPPAGRFQRGLAWLTDISFTVGAQAILYAPFMLIEPVLRFLDNRPLLRVLTAGTTFLVPFLTMWLQCWLGSSIGKKLFQIRVVDNHGLPPAKSVVASRSVFQFLLVWGAAVMHLVRALRLEALLPLIPAVCFSILLMEMAFVLFSKRRRSLHDVIFRTQVVLDAGQTVKR